jgi:polyisoprenoid-binding protein YceI
MVTKVRGQFTDFEGHLHLDADDPTRSTALVTVDPASVTTHHEKRDAHLRGPDFFDVEQYTALTFESTSAESVDDLTYRLSGKPDDP